MKERESKGLAIVAYITFIGMIIAYFLNRDKKSEFVRAHVQNMFGLFLILIVSQVTQAYINPYLGDGLWLVSFLLWAFSLVTAILGDFPRIPVLSDKFREWFVFLQ